MLTNPFSVREIGALDLARQLEAGDAVQLLDVRAPFCLAAAGRIDTQPPASFFNMAGSQLMALRDPAELGLNRALPVVTICGHGNDSRTIAGLLQMRGYDVASLAGGMAAWMQLLVPRSLTAPAGFDHLVQLDRVGKGALGYLLVSGGEALVIDPPRNTTTYEFGADALGARIVGVADTHVHADYISGAPALAARLGVPYYLHPADSSYAFDGTPGQLDYTAIDDGEQLRVGTGSLWVTHTPGHTEGSVSFIAGDAAFTGDFIFVGSVGRPDLAGKSEAWTAQLFDSLSRAKRDWPESARILPAHYAGQDERSPDRSMWATLRDARARNAPLDIDDAAQFAAWVSAHLKEPPPAYRRIKGINVGLFPCSDAEASELEAGKNECAIS